MSFSCHSFPDSLSHYLQLGQIYGDLETSGKIEELSLILREVCVEALRGRGVELLRCRGVELLRRPSIDPRQLLEILKAVIAQLLDKAMAEASLLAAGDESGARASSGCVTPGGRNFPFFRSVKGELFPVTSRESPRENLQSYLESRGIKGRKSQRSTELFADLEAANAYDLGAKAKARTDLNKDTSHLLRAKIEGRLSERCVPPLEKYPHSHANYRLPSIPTQRKSVSSKHPPSTTHRPFRASQAVELLRR